MKYLELTNEEKEILYKRVLRFHKENKSLSFFRKKVYGYSKKFFLTLTPSTEINEFLIGPVWRIVRDHIMAVNHNSNLSTIIASVSQMEFAYSLLLTNNKKFKIICEEIIATENSYLKNYLNNNKVMIPKAIGEKIKKLSDKNMFEL